LLWAALLCDSGLAVTTPPAQRHSPWRRRLLASHGSVSKPSKITTIGVDPGLITTLIAQSAFAVSALATPAALRHFAHDVGLTAAFMLFELRLADQLGQQALSPIDDLLDLCQRLRMEIDQRAPSVCQSWQSMP